MRLLCRLLPCSNVQEDRSNAVVSEEDANGVDQEIEELCQEVAQVSTLGLKCVGTGTC
jgi:hypothetical protein